MCLCSNGKASVISDIFGWRERNSGGFGGGKSAETDAPALGWPGNLVAQVGAGHVWEWRSFGALYIGLAGIGWEYRIPYKP